MSVRWLDLVDSTRQELESTKVGLEPDFRRFASSPHPAVSTLIQLALFCWRRWI